MTDIGENNGEDCGGVGKKAAEAWPPAGWVTNHEAARRLDVGVETLTCAVWWRPMLRACGQCVRHPNGGRCNIYPAAEIERIKQARAAAAVVKIPEGFVDMDGAARMFGLSRNGWKTWVRLGKVRFGHAISSPTGGRQKVYAIADLGRLREELFGEDKLYKDASNAWHVPAGFVRREEAWEKFGVAKVTWERWEREGTIICGMRVPSGPKLYKIEDVERMLDEYGKYCPPYPDPDRPGVYRVPLSGRDIKRREVLVDAASLALIEGATCSWATADQSRFVSLHRPGDSSGTPLRRVIMGVRDGGFNVRHVNRDPLDCRRENLVVRTIKQRARNARKVRTVNGRPPTSRFKGVHWETRIKSWRARIRVEEKTRNLGRFGDEIAAAEAYDEAAREFFGEHAWLNFPDGIDAWLEGEANRRARAEAA